MPNLPREAFDLDRIGDREFILGMLCDARPATRPGRLTAYHAVSGGLIVAEIVRRVIGRGIRDVLADEILDPLGFRWANFGVAPEDVDLVARCAQTGPPVLPPLSTLLTRALGVGPSEIVALGNDPRFLTGLVPSANVVTTAAELSRFFELLRRGGELDGPTRTYSPGLIRSANSRARSSRAASRSSTSSSLSSTTSCGSSAATPRRCPARCRSPPRPAAGPSWPEPSEANPALSLAAVERR